MSGVHGCGRDPDHTGACIKGGTGCSHCDQTEKHPPSSSSTGAEINQMGTQMIEDDRTNSVADGSVLAVPEWVSSSRFADLLMAVSDAGLTATVEYPRDGGRVVRVAGR